MQKSILNLKNMFFNTDTEMKSLIEKKYYWTGIITALIGICSYPLVSLLGRVLNEQSNREDIWKTLLFTPIKAVLFYIISVSLVYIISKAFRGKGKYLSLVSDYGWTWIPLFLVSVTLTPVLMSGMLVAQYPGSQKLLSVIALFCVFLIIAEIILAYKMTTRAIAISMSLGRGRSIAIFLLAFLPQFLLFDLFF